MVRDGLAGGADRRARRRPRRHRRRTSGAATGPTRAGTRRPRRTSSSTRATPRRPPRSCGSAARTSTPIVPFGAGTSLEGHVAALEGGVSVDMTQMNRDPAAVGRGHGRDRPGRRDAPPARREAAARGRVLLASTPAPTRRSAGWSPPARPARPRVRYGTMRENVLSLTVVTADGEIVRTRSRARKSSAGYDLTRLFVGSEGTLGLITEVTLRLQPTPEAMTAARCAFPTLDDAVDTVIEVLAHAIPVARIELLDDVQIDAVNRHFELDLAVAPTLFLEFHGTPDETAGAGARTSSEIAARPRRRSASTGPPTSPSGARSGTPATAPTRPRRALRPGSQGFTTDACVPISNLAATASRRPRPTSTRPACSRRSSATSATATSTSRSSSTPTTPRSCERAKALNDRLVRRAIAADGTCTGEHGVGYGKTRVPGARARPGGAGDDARDQVSFGSRRPVQSGQGRAPRHSVLRSDTTRSRSAPRPRGERRRVPGHPWPDR